MTRCQLCNIHQTDDPYHICQECRAKAAAKWPTYREWINRIENPRKAAVATEPADVDFVRAMGW